MDRILRRQLEAIARDRTSGAAELALAVVDLLITHLRRAQSLAPPEWLPVLSHLYAAQPAMAPLLRIANELALAMSAQNASHLREALLSFRQTILRAPTLIAGRFRSALPRQKSRVLTYSYSSTVLRALLAARSRIRVVVCSESRPGGEGRRLAARLAKAGVWTQLVTDAELFSRVLQGDHVVVGADCILRDSFVNKIGTSILLRNALETGARVWILADTTKLWPETFLEFLSRSVRVMQPGPLKTIWKNSPKNVDALYTSASLFGHTWFDPRMKFLTEHGWTTSAQIRKRVAKLRLSPLLKKLPD